MPVEVAKLVDDFNKLWPRGTDPVSKADDHIRMIKEVLQLEFELLYNKKRVFSFEAGAVVNPGCILYYEAEKAFYQWNGAYDVNNEHVVYAGSTPATSGGVGANAWTRSTGSGFMSTVLVSDIEPTAPFQNMLWWDTNSGIFFIYYNDGTSTQWVDLFGIANQATFNTLLIRSILARLAAESGYTLVGGSFQEGAISSGFSDVVLDWGTVKFYQWHLNENKVIPAGSTPATSGGIGAGAWVDRTDVTLRDEITPSVTEALRRSYAEAGYNMASGSFEAGGTLVNANDVLLQERTGMAFSWAGTFPKVVAAGATPATSGGVGANAWKDQSHTYATVTAAQFGAFGNGLDYTTQLQAALNELESRGGGTLLLGPGVFCLSIANSISAYACLVVPANITIRGAGKLLTTIQRIPVERGVNGVLMVNKGFDKVTTPFGAAGNHVYEDFHITDGSVGPSRTSGDLIGAGNCENLIVRNCHFGIHDQHAVDLSAVRNALISNCTGINGNDGGYNASATIQVDGSPGIIGQIDVAANSENVTVENCTFKSTSSREVLHVGHKPISTDGIYRNIRFINNVIDGAYVWGSFAVRFDPDCGFDGLQFIGNKFIINHDTANGLNIALSGSAGTVLNDCKVIGNTVTGTGRLGLYVGSSTNISTRPTIKNIVVSNNVVDITTATTTTIAYAATIANLEDSIIANNNFRLTATNADTTDASALRVLYRNKNLTIKNNSCRLSVPNVPESYFIDTSKNLQCVIVTPNNSLLTDGSLVELVGNSIHQGNCRYALAISTIGSGFDPTKDSVVISKNTFNGVLQGQFTLFDALGFSSMDNGGTDVVMPNGAKVMTLGANQSYTITNYGGIKSRKGAVRLEPTLKTGAGYRKINNVVVESQACGVDFVDITESSFKLNTGAGGVSGNISAGVFVALESGDVSIKAFI